MQNIMTNPPRATRRELVLQQKLLHPQWDNATIAHQLHYSTSFVQHTLTRFRQLGTVQDVPHTGRPPTFSDHNSDGLIITSARMVTRQRKVLQMPSISN